MKKFAIALSLVAALALTGACSSKSDSSPKTQISTPVTLVNCSALFTQYTDLNSQAADVMAQISSTPGAVSALRSDIKNLIVADVDAGRKLIAACPQYSYLNPAINNLEDAGNSF